jgi:hypothetical protein
VTRVCRQAIWRQRSRPNWRTASKSVPEKLWKIVNHGIFATINLCGVTSVLAIAWILQSFT